MSEGQPERGWQAELQLGFARDGARTALVERRHSGPLRVQRPFSPEGPDVCHVYLLHPPGGLVSGDELHVRAQVQDGAHAILTPHGAAKLYRSCAATCPARQVQSFGVHGAGVLEWLPQETIAFRGARAQLSTRVELAEHARFIGWEIVCLGRPAAGERFDEGSLWPSFELLRAGKSSYLERGQYAGGQAVLDAPWGLAGQPVSGTLICAAPAAHGCVEVARAALAEVLHDAGAQGRAAVSGWDDLLVARYLGPSSEVARNVLSAIWAAVRPGLLGRPACAPRIWRT